MLTDRPLSLEDKSEEATTMLTQGEGQKEYIDQDWMQADNRQVKLAPGKSVAVEIKTG
ncbi:hypothetical protein [Endozoicomonas euniceicola]|uniref:Uncharacterized protein n=1 Tax=Endozoicomonas euniceicola TaxID=1234143 RepID=A0ABY6GT60_9GAMM|nr:hypothetical protein [Endozoicomonas euniceicola]UYM15951.1 hypothetical protein NX720_24575 [Endozoicomonas euniceicola]